MTDRALVVRLEALIDQYNRDMNSAAQATERVGDAAVKTGQQTTKGMEQGRRSVGQFAKDNGRLFKGMERGGKALMVGVTTPIVGLGIAVGRTGTAYNALEQRSRAALATLLGSAEAATRQMETLYRFTSTSPFPRQVMIEAQQQLIGFGMAAEDVVPVLGAVQDAVAATGGSAQDISEVVDVLARIQGQGRITGIELQRLGIRGIDAAGILAEHFGVTGDEIRDRISAGAVDADMAITGLVAGIEQRMGGAADAVKDTWDGAVDRVKAAFRDLSSAIVEPFVSVEGGGAAVEGANALADGLRAVEDAYRGLSDGQQTAIVGIAGLAAGVGPALWTVGRLGRAVINTRDNLEAMHVTKANVVKFLRSRWVPVLAGATLALGELARRSAEAGQANRALTDHMQEVAEGADQLSDAFLRQHMQQSGTLHTWETLGLSMEQLRGAIRGVPEDVEAVQGALEGNRSSWENWSDALNNVSGGLLGTSNQYRDLHGVLYALSQEYEEFAPILEESERKQRSNEASAARLTAQAEAAGVEVGNLGDEFADQADQAETAAEAIDEYLAALQRAYDPVFKLVSALDDVADAQAEYDATLKDSDASQVEVERSALKLAEAVAKAESAALSSDLSFEDFARKLEHWVEAGVLTAEQAEVIADRVAEARGEAQEYTGVYDAILTLDTNAADAALEAWKKKLEEAGFSKPAGAAAWGARYHAQGTAHFADPQGDGPGRPGGGSAAATVRSAMQGIPGLRISSMYRTPAHNARVGGSPTSYHLDRSNPAVDIAGPTASLDRLAARLRRLPHRELLWRTAGHWDHVHFANRGGRLPGYGTRDTVPAMLTPGEYVVNADATRRFLPLLEWVNAQRLNTGGRVQPGYDVGRLMGMTRAASFGPSWEHAAAIERMRSAYEQMTAEIERAARAEQRAALVARRRAAESAEQRKEATKALREFDRETRLQEQRRQIEARIAAAEHAAAMKRNREQWQFETMSARQQVAWLERQLTATERYTDEWVRLASQRRQILDRERDDARRVAEQRVADVQRMLDAMEDAQRRHDDRAAQARQRAADAETQALERRTDELRRALSLDLSGEFARSASSIIGQLERQQAQLSDWATALAEARARGLSDEAVDLLGLADGPEALGQLRELLGATDDELARLSATVADRQADLTRRVEREAADAHTALGRELAGIRETLDADLREAAVELEGALTQIGQDSGRAWADAVAQGLRSGVPTIVQAVRDAQAALRDQKSAEAAAAATPPAKLTRRQQIEQIWRDVGVSLAFGSESAAERLTRLEQSGRSLADLRRSAELQRANHPGTRLTFHGGGIVPGRGGEMDVRVLGGEGIFTAEQMRHLAPVTAAAPQVVVVEKVIERIPTGPIPLVLPDGQQVDAYFDGRIARHEDTRRRAVASQLRGGRS